MKLRGHHLLCTQGFQGYGYDKSFTDNMKQVVNKLNTSDNLWIKITDTCDEICVKCPNSNGEECSKDHIKTMDSIILKELKLTPGDRLKKEDVFTTIKKHSQKLQKVCKGCEWQQVCLFYNNP
ncbi:MAG: DUF1284 domain-containing protein [bacterium]|nr:DUF1284 domain-containing protein [bacterium]